MKSNPAFYQEASHFLLEQKNTDIFTNNIAFTLAQTP